LRESLYRGMCCVLRLGIAPFKFFLSEAPRCWRMAFGLPRYVLKAAEQAHLGLAAHLD
jgi:hypothetical protein